MLESKEIITYIFAIGAAQAILLFFILLKKKENSFANKFLALTMLIFALDLMGGVSLLAGYIKSFPWILGFNNSFPYLYGPLIYLFVIFLIHRQELFYKYNYLHFLPFILIHIYGLFFFYFEGSEYQLSLLDFSIEQPWHISIIGILIPFHGTAYIIFTVIEVLRFNKNIKKSFSNIEHIDLSWLLYLVFGGVIIWLVVLLSYLMGYVLGDKLEAHLLIYITISVFLYTFAIKSYKQPEIRNSDLTNRKNGTYKKSGLSKEKAEEYTSKIVKFMIEEKPYLETKLSLSQLAEQLDLSAHNISEIINTKLDNSFYDFVNKYRVNEVKTLIEIDKEAKYSILAHGFDAGFTSKSTYYSAFKKFTGMTPAQFRNKKT